MLYWHLPSVYMVELLDDAHSSFHPCVHQTSCTVDKPTLIVVPLMSTAFVSPPRHVPSKVHCTSVYLTLVVIKFVILIQRWVILTSRFQLVHPTGLASKRRLRMSVLLLHNVVHQRLGELTLLLLVLPIPQNQI